MKTIGKADTWATKKKKKKNWFPERPHLIFIVYLFPFFLSPFFPVWGPIHSITAIWRFLEQKSLICKEKKNPFSSLPSIRYRRSQILRRVDRSFSVERLYTTWGSSSRYLIFQFFLSLSLSLSSSFSFLYSPTHWLHFDEGFVLFIYLWNRVICSACVENLLISFSDFFTCSLWLLLLLFFYTLYVFIIEIFSWNKKRKRSSWMISRVYWPQALPIWKKERKCIDGVEIGVLLTWMWWNTLVRLSVRPSDSLSLRLLYSMPSPLCCITHRDGGKEGGGGGDPAAREERAASQVN